MPRNKPAKPSRIPFILSGAITALAYPPLNLWFLAWISLLPLIVGTRSLTFGVAFRRGWWGGLFFNAGLLYWIGLNSGAEGPIALASLLGMLLIFPLYWSLFAAFWAFLWNRCGDLAALLLPALWVALEVVKNAPEIGFPWLELGLTQIEFPPAAQLAEIGGIRFVSAWVVGANVAFFLLLYGRRKVFVGLTLMLIAGLVWGQWRLNHLPEPGASLKAIIVQGNVDPAAKWVEDPDSSLVLYEKLTTETVAREEADLLIWPETAVPVYLGHQIKYQRRLRALAESSGAAILTGAPHYEIRRNAREGHDRFNSAFFFPKDGTKPSRYDKIRLVPFGERVPFQKFWPRLGELNFGQAEFTAGKSYVVFDPGNGVKISAQICFESVFGQETRRFVLNGARVLCNLTNDGWYGNSSGPYQHAALVRFKCIETRCPLLRAANTGISLAADRTGRVIESIPYNERGTFAVQVESGGNDLTFYVRHGELIPWLMSLLALFGILISACWGRTGRRL